VPEARIDELRDKKKQLEEIRANKVEGIILRSKARWIDQGEKPTKYFLNLEKRNYVSKLIPKIITEDGIEIRDGKEILEEQKRFYQKLYTEKDNKSHQEVREFLHTVQGPKLSNTEADALEGKITYAELTTVLKKQKNNKTPGIDGYSAEFYKFFWKDIGHFVLRAINESYDKGLLPITLRRGVITCLPKGNKCRHYLKNWRPLSLLCVPYKLASACIAERIKLILPKIIHEDQQGFMQGRFIGQNIRQLYDVLLETKLRKIPGLLLLVDFEKAFDSVSWNFLQESLTFFNFGSSLRKWVEIFYKGIQSSVLQNGHMSSFFDIGRGCRQGDPLSPYLFLIAAEILGIMIRKNDKIRGIQIEDTHYKLGQYADDTQLYLNGTESSMSEALQTLQLFYGMSGLKINIEKTQAVWIGSKSQCMDMLCKDYKLDWNPRKFKVLGINFSTDVHEIWELNFMDKYNAMQQLLGAWKKRKLTLLGKIAVIKSLAVSKFTHLFLALPNPPTHLLKRLVKLLYKYLWNDGNDRIKRNVITKPYKEGGLQMINLEVFIQALKISWLRKIIDNRSPIGSSFKLIESQFNKLISISAKYLMSPTMRQVILRPVIILKKT
jgi:hypothetical protein